MVTRPNILPRYLALSPALLMLSLGAIACVAGPALRKSQPQTDDPAEIIRRAAANDEENDKRSRDYTYVEHEMSTELDKHGKTKSTHSKTQEVFTLDGDEMDRLIAKDGKPLPEKDAKKEEDRINKWMEKRQSESADEKRKRMERAEKDREEGRAFVKEVALAFNFTTLPHETIGGREAFVIDAAPKPGYQPKDRNSKILPKVKFRVWIDTQEYQAIKLQVTVIDTFSFGAFIFRLHPGSQFLLEQTRVNDEVWLPQHVAVKIDVRFVLLKNYDGDVDVTYGDYKKFRSEVKISPVKQ
jgi:hypothetical protein